MFSRPHVHLTYLYAPATRPDLMAKALASGAHVLVADLEDAVPAARKDEAREIVRRFAHTLPDPRSEAVPTEVHARINREGSAYSDADVDAVVQPALTGLRLPKAEDPDAVRSVAASLDELEVARGLPRGAIAIYPLIETAIGVARLEDLAASLGSRMARFALGITDLMADLGIPDESGGSTLALRSELVFRSRVAGLPPPIDSVYTHLDDEEGLRRSARWARQLGFLGKSVIHPKQLAIVEAAFRPEPAEVEWARRVIATYESSASDGIGAFRLDGELVDVAMVRRAEAVLDLTRDDG